MNILAVDDETFALNYLVDSLKSALPEASIHGFLNSGEALTYAKSERVDVAFLDIEMREMSGLELARQLKKIREHTNLVFVTGYDDFTGDAFQLLASGYVLKPVRVRDIKRQMENLRYQVQTEQPVKRVRIQCFGNFEVYLDGKPVPFAYSKAKEMLAYLVDRNGALCTTHEIMAVLWEDEIKESYFQNIRRSLVSVLPEDILVRQKGKMGIATQEVDCDYYDFLCGRRTAFAREYMTQYSWSEATLGEMIRWTTENN